MADMAMMSEKWRITFKLLDFKQDGTINIEDKDACKQSFLDVYKPNDEQSKTMLNHLDQTWNHAIFLIHAVDWGQSFNVDEFVKTRGEAYTKDKNATVAATRKGMQCLLAAADLSGKTGFNYDDFRKFHVAFNIKQEGFIKGVYAAIGGTEGGVVSAESAVEFYTELIMGDDVEKHEKCKAFLASVGFA